MTEITKKSTEDFLQKPVTRKFAGLLVCVLCFAAFGYRLIGIAWGLPSENRHQSLHPDEYQNLLVATETPYFKPGFYNYGTFYFTAWHLATDMGKSYGWIPKLREGEEWKTNRASTLTGRVVSAIAGAATVGVVFLILLRISNLLGALIGSLAIFMAPGLSVHSRFATPDVFAMFWLALAALILLRAWQSDERRMRDFVLAGLFTGLSAGTKYTGALFILSLCVAAIILDRKSALKVIGMCFAAMLLGFLIATPGALLESNAFFSGLQYEMAHSAAGHGIVFANTPSGFVFHVSNMFSGIGLVAAMLGAIGWVWASTMFAKTKNPGLAWAVIFGAFFLAYYVLIGRAEVKFMRYVFPLLPFIAVGLGWLVGHLHERGGRFRWAAGTAMLFFFFSFSTSQGGVMLTTIMVQVDSRDWAGKWLREKIPDKTLGFANDPWFYSPAVFPDTGLLGAPNRIKAMTKFNSNLKRYAVPGEPTKEWDTRLLTETKPDFVVFSTLEASDHHRINQPDFVAFMDILSKNYEPHIVFYSGTYRVIRPEEAKARFGRVELHLHTAAEAILPHDMRYIQTTIWLFRKRTTN